MKKILVTLSVAVLVFASCAKDEVVPQTGVSAQPGKTALYPGEYTDANAVISPSNATSNYLSWKSSDTKIAAVTGHGQVIAIAPAYDKMGPGKATITATTVDGKFFSSFEITVNPIPITSISFEKSEVTVEPDASITLVPVFTPANASYQDSLVWSSDNTTVATVDKDGNVKGLEWGTANITVKELYGGKTGVCKVTVKDSKPEKALKLHIWRKNKAGQKQLLGKVLASSTADWLTLDADGIAHWTENVSGGPRKATLLTKDGDSLVVTQFEDSDFRASSYTMTCKLFDKTSGTLDQNNNATVSLTPVAAVCSETLKTAEGAEVKNVFGLKGLYFDAVIDVAFQIDREAKTIKLGLFCDTRNKAQLAGNGKDDYKYAAFAPELATKWAAPYNFVAINPNKRDYCWIWFTGDKDFKTFVYDNNSPQVEADATSETCNQIVGISVAISKKVNVDNDNVYLPNNTGDYHKIFQFNPNNVKKSVITRN